MDNSAKDDPAAKGKGPHLSARMLKTRLAITRQARTLTTEHGYNGFTVEQLCEHVGISRRTFFNYFPTKLDAVFGHETDEIPEGAVERFMAARPEGLTGISPTLLADLVELALEQLTHDEQAIVSTHGFFSVIHREPELLQRMMQVGPEKEAEFLQLMATREGVEPDDPQLVVLVHILHLAVMKSVDRYVKGSGERSITEEFLEYMEKARNILAQPLTRPNP